MRSHYAPDVAVGLTAVAPSGRPFHPKYRLSIRGAAPALTAYGLSGRKIVPVIKRLRVLIVSSFVIKYVLNFGKDTKKNEKRKVYNEDMVTFNDGIYEL